MDIFQNSHLVFIASWGTGKTLLMFTKARELNDLGEKVLILVFLDGDSVEKGQKSLLILDLEEKLKDCEHVTVKGVLYIDGKPMLDIDGNVYSCGMYKDCDSGSCRDLKSPDDETFWKKNHAYPSKVLGLGKLVAIDAGKHYNAALEADGTLYTWGMGNSGELARSKSM